VLGDPRQDWTTAARPSPGAELLDGGEGPREAVRLMQVPLAEGATRSVDRRGIQLGEPERVEVLELLVRERVVDLSGIDVARSHVGLREGRRGRALGGYRSRPVAALDRGRVLAPADPVQPHGRVPGSPILGCEDDHDASVRAPRGLMRRERVEHGLRRRPRRRRTMRAGSTRRARVPGGHIGALLDGPAARVEVAPHLETGQRERRHAQRAVEHGVQRERVDPAGREDVRRLRVRLDRDHVRHATPDQHHRRRHGEQTVEATVCTGRWTAPS
jgi:hypothetical protein